MGLPLLVRTDDLAPACREAGEFLAFRQRKAGRDPHDDHVMGIWIHRGMLMEAPSRIALRIAGPVVHDPDTGLPSLDEE
jgi:hypothetical protein